MVAEFKPGFRLSVVDTVFVIAVGTLSFVFLQDRPYLLTLCLLGPLQFFLFCNVFRVSRIPELVWASVFIAVSWLSFRLDMPLWIPVAVAVMLGVLVIGFEMTQKSYHGIFWERINPGLKSCLNQ
jgi:hypothetical protein